MANGNGFEITIKQAGGVEIYLGDEVIKSIEFSIDTVNDNVKDRSEDVLNRVLVKGTITPEVKEPTKNLLLWSLAKKSEEIYRSAEITVKINQTNRVRKYTMDKVFCLDYKEEFFNGSEDCKFELKFAQRKDNMDGISVIC